MKGLIITNGLIVAIVSLSIEATTNAPLKQTPAIKIAAVTSK